MQANGGVEASFSCEQRYQGYNGYLHGGIISALLDSAMTNCLFAQGRAALTGVLNVRFLKPVIVNLEATVTARMKKSAPPLFYMVAELLQNGRIMAKSTATFMEPEHGIATPANWQPGDDVIVPPPGSCGVAKDRTEKPDPDVTCLDWFMCLKKCPQVR